MRTIAPIVGLLILLMFSACGNGDNEHQEAQQEQISQMHEQVMEIHDEAMPWMRPLGDYLEQAERKLDSLQLEDAPEERIAEKRELINRIRETREAMNEWMQQYDEPGEDMAYEQAVEYLVMERDRISRIRDRMQEALEQAETHLEN